MFAFRALALTDQINGMDAAGLRAGLVVPGFLLKL